MKNIKTNPLFNKDANISVGSIVDLNLFKTHQKSKNDLENASSEPECNSDCQYKGNDIMCATACPYLYPIDESNNDNLVTFTNEQEHFVFVEFKGNRRDIFLNNKRLDINNGDEIIVSTETGLDIGKVSNTIWTSKDKILEQYNKTIQQYVIRLANDTDIEDKNNNRLDENNMRSKIEIISSSFGLEMNLVDVEWQFDRHKLTIFFTASQRIDFRELVKELAKQFRTRIELRQINTREEVKRKSNTIASCGNKLCCTIFSPDMSKATLEHAKVQQLSNNISKLSGYCRRIKCCMSYEYDFYEKELSQYPPINSIIQLDKLQLKLIKIDVFKHIATLYNITERIYTTMDYAKLDKLVKAGKVILPVAEEKSGIDEDIIIE